MNTGGSNPLPSEKCASAVPSSYWLGLLLVLCTVVSYWPALSAGFIWDDDDYIINNHTLRTLHGLWEIWFDPFATPQYYPLVHTTFWLEYHMWGLNPLGFHIVNVLLHATGALLLWRILARLVPEVAWLAAAVFAVHPVQVESVAWVTELKNILSAVFYFAAAMAYFRFWPESDGENPRRNWRFYWIAMALFFAALLCKTVACSLPAALLLIYWWKRNRLSAGDVLPLLPFFFLGICMGLATAWIEKHHVGAQGAYWTLTFLQRILIAGRALCFHFMNLLWPACLTFSYPRWQVDPHDLWQWSFPVVVAGLILAFWFFRQRIGKGCLVALLFFAGTLVPALGFINVYPMQYTFVADHYQYLACVGLIILILKSTNIFFEASPIITNSRIPACIALLLCLGTLTWRQCGIYHDLKTLWADTLRKNPASWMAHVNWGRLLAQEGHVDEAEAHYQSAIDINPHEESIYYNYANLLARNGQLDAAMEEYQLTLKIAPGKAEVHNNLGIVLNRLHRTDEAIAEYKSAISLQPDYADAYFNLGNALSAEHKMDEAVSAYRHAVQLNPDSEPFRNRLQALTGQPTAQQ